LSPFLVGLAVLGRRKRSGRRTMLSWPPFLRLMPERAGAYQSQNVDNTRTEQNEIHDNEQNQRQAHLGGIMRRDGIGRSHQSMNNPGLSPDLGGIPACEYRHQAAGTHAKRKAMQPPLRI